MNLFRSEEHARNWSEFDAVSAESIMPVADYASAFSGPLFRNRLDPDYLSFLHEYAAELFIALKKLGRSGEFWVPG